MSSLNEFDLTNLLITGCYRTGTTLIEKLLHSHPKICIASQPFPVLYFYIKTIFYEKFGLRRLYPLGSLFLEDSYSLSDFYEFLDNYKLSKEDIDNIFIGLKEYKKGLWTPEILDFKDKVEEGTFFNVYRQLNNFIPKIFLKEGIAYIGSKEILCEEYVPYLISKGVRVIIILRDPRDMIASLNFRKKDNLTGEKRPILYSLRLWRKSVAIALKCVEHSNFMWLKYEDLVENPLEILKSITSFLNIEIFSHDIFKNDIRDQYGNLWNSNSSFESHTGISKDSIERYINILPDYIISYIEACCLPEMKFLGYGLKQIENFAKTILYNFKEPFSVKHEKFVNDKDYSRMHVEEEIERYNKLTDSNTLSPEEARKWFLFDDVYKKYSSLLNE